MLPNLLLLNALSTAKKRIALAPLFVNLRVGISFNPLAIYAGPLLLDATTDEALNLTNDCGLVSFHVVITEPSIVSESVKLSQTRSFIPKSQTPNSGSN